MPQIHQRRGLGGRLYHGETAIDFYGRRWWGIAVSSALLVVTFASLLFQGLNLGIDFEGGVAWEVSADNVSVNQARSILDDHGINGTDAKVQQRTSASGSVLLIQVGDQSVAKRQEVQEALATKANVPTESVSVTSVSSTWGRSITEKADRIRSPILALSGEPKASMLPGSTVREITAVTFSDWRSNWLRPSDCTAVLSAGR